MSAEAEVRAALVAYAGLTALVPAARISIDSVQQGLPRPYIAFSKQNGQRFYGLDNTPLATIDTIDVQCVGSDRANAIAVREQVEAALIAAGVPPTGVSAGYDPDNDLEVEVVTVDW